MIIEHDNGTKHVDWIVCNGCSREHVKAMYALASKNYSFPQHMNGGVKVDDCW